MNNREKALALIALEIPVFKVRVSAEGVKTPLHARGHLDATLDPGLADDWFTENPKAEVGAWMGGAGLLAVDVDMKNGKDGWESLELSWNEIPETFSYGTPTGGTHLIYTAPEGLNLAPSANYRGMQGVDIRAGSSWVLWNGDVPASRDAFAPAPEWTLDTVSVKSADKFEGTLRDWFDGLEPGEPNAIVRKAMSRILDDMSHSDMVKATYEAIRIGAEGNPGVLALLSALEDAWISRDPGNHTTPEDAWEYKFHEALSSGITNYGEKIGLIKELPAYSLAVVPKSVPDRLVTGTNGTKQDFTDLLRALLAATDDDMLVTSVLWNCPKTKDLAREWGLLFVHERVTSARLKPEPVRENPTLPAPEEPTDRYRSPAGQIPDQAELDMVAQRREKKLAFLSAEEAERVKNTETFIDRYLAASATKGFSNPVYDVPAAWTCLSMAFGFKYFIPKGVNLYTNVWFLLLGYSGTGKSASDEYLTWILDTLFKDGESVYYNLGASSSPEGLHESLLERDEKPSIIHHDEASDFFEELQTKDWMKTLKDRFAKWYSGRVDPMQKVRLKELRGKFARTSFNIHMMATPKRLTGLIDTGMFASGFLARFNWVWGPEPVETDDKYGTEFSDPGNHGVPMSVYGLAGDLADAASYNTGGLTPIVSNEQARVRLEQAFRDFDKDAKKHERYEVLEPAITRLGRETVWKIAALNALYRGDEEILLEDALVAVYHCQDWYRDLTRVVEATSENDFSRDVAEIEAYVKAMGGNVSEAKLMHRFRSMIQRSPRELEDRVAFLKSSGRVNRVDLGGGRIGYELNGQ